MKRNSFLDRVQKVNAENMRTAQYINERQCLDAMIVALNEEFGFGKDRIRRVISAYVRNRKEIANMFMDDKKSNGDKMLNYSKEKLDRTLRQFMGEQFPPFEERYCVDIGKPMFDGGVIYE